MSFSWARMMDMVAMEFMLAMQMMIMRRSGPQITLLKVYSTLY